MLCLSVKTLQTIKIGSNFSKFIYLFWKSGSVFHLQRPTVQAQVVGWKQSLVLEKFCLRLRWGVLNKVVVSRGKTRTWARFFYRGERRQASSVTTVTGKAKKATRILACGSKEQSIGKIKERQQHSSLSLTLYFPRFFFIFKFKQYQYVLYTQVRFTCVKNTAESQNSYNKGFSYCFEIISIHYWKVCEN